MQVLYHKINFSRNKKKKFFHGAILSINLGEDKEFLVEMQIWGMYSLTDRVNIGRKEHFSFMSPLNWF